MARARFSRNVRIISVIDDRGPAFGRRTDNDEKVYVPARLRNRCSMAPGDVFRLILKRNTKHPDNTPWFARKATSPDPESEEIWTNDH